VADLVASFVPLYTIVSTVKSDAPDAKKCAKTLSDTPCADCTISSSWYTTRSYTRYPVTGLELAGMFGADQVRDMLELVAATTTRLVTAGGAVEVTVELLLDPSPAELTALTASE
jgi:hypothetical protein